MNKIIQSDKSAHHHGLVEIYFQPQGARSVCQIGRTEFKVRDTAGPGLAAGASSQHAEIALRHKTVKQGSLYIVSYGTTRGPRPAPRENPVSHLSGRQEGEQR